MCTFGLKAISATSTTTTSSREQSSVSAVVESIEDSETDAIKSDLEKAETSKEPQKVEIIKQIQKLNNDGSYTVGYEAEDGTFKIESRDVLGNVKGTFGYVDENGEIKRVSYTANNGTGLKSLPISAEETVHIPRYNRSSVTPTTRRPVYSSSSTAAPTRATVIQSIPKRLRVLSASPTERAGFRDHSSSTQRTAKQDATTTVVYATSVPTPKPYVNIRPTPLPGTNIRPSEQIARPEKLEINHVSKVQLLPNRDISTTKPVVEEIDEKEDIKKSIRGNSLRRQLMPDFNEKYDAQTAINNYNQASSDEEDHFYNPSRSTARPFFPTTNRIPALVLAARQRAAQAQNVLNSNNQNTDDKLYVRPLQPKRTDSTDNDPTTEPTSEQVAYLTQSPIPVQIPANRNLNQGQDEERRSVRRPLQSETNRYRNTQYIRAQQFNGQPQDSPRLVRLPIPQNSQQVDEHDQYLREATQPTAKNEQVAEQEPVPARIPPGFYRNTPKYYVYPEQQAASYYPPPAPTPVPQYPLPFRGAPINPAYFDYAERPLTTRDFERLLHILILRHQQLQRLGGVPPYSGYPASFPYQGYSPYSRPPYNPPYNAYDARIPYRPPLSPYTDPENMYDAQTPIPAAEAPMPYELQRLIPRKKQYNPRYFGAQAGAYNMEEYGASTVTNPNHVNYLPSHVREELLYRMLMLALQTEPQPVIAAASMQSAQISDTDSSTTTKSPIIYKKPVRSVQILGEEQ